MLNDVSALLNTGYIRGYRSLRVNVESAFGRLIDLDNERILTLLLLIRYYACFNVHHKGISIIYLGILKSLTFNLCQFKTDEESL